MLRTITGGITASILDMVMNSIPANNRHLYFNKYLFKEARFFISGKGTGFFREILIVAKRHLPITKDNIFLAKTPQLLIFAL